MHNDLVRHADYFVFGEPLNRVDSGFMAPKRKVDLFGLKAVINLHDVCTGVRDKLLVVVVRDCIEHSVGVCHDRFILHVKTSHLCLLI